MLNKKACGFLDEQGYTFLSDEQKSKLNIALRVTPSVCIALVIVGLYYQSIAIFFTLSIFGILGTTFSKGQPVDVFYNIVAGFIKWPKLPPSPTPRRFACSIGTFFLIGATISFYFGSALLGYIFGVSYILAAGLMALTHFCIASWIYHHNILKK